MRTTRSVYAAFAIAAVTVLVLAACGASGPAAGTPEALYVDLGCAKCHGDHWQEESLLEYLADPKGVMEQNPRLKYMAENFPIMMPAYPDTSEEDLRKLAQLILGS